MHEAAVCQGSRAVYQGGGKGRSRNRGEGRTGTSERCQGWGAGAYQVSTISLRLPPRASAAKPASDKRWNLRRAGRAHHRHAGAHTEGMVGVWAAPSSSVRLPVRLEGDHLEDCHAYPWRGHTRRLCPLKQCSVPSMHPHTPIDNSVLRHAYPLVPTQGRSGREKKGKEGRGCPPAGL